jgi:hypothetical protein
MQRPLRAQRALVLNAPFLTDDDKRAILGGTLEKLLTV